SALMVLANSRLVTPSSVTRWKRLPRNSDAKLLGWTERNPCDSPTFSTMPSLRLQRVRELLKREIGEAIRREFEVSEAGLITVNDVDVSGDLHSAVVFISILGNADQQKRGLNLLTRHRKRIQGLVGRAVVL